MKFPSLLAAGVAAALILPLPVAAQDTRDPGTAPKPTEQTVKQMRDNVKKMQSQLDRLGKARTDAEVRNIMAEHMQTMRDNMMLARGMGGMDCAMMGYGMGHPGMMGGGMGQGMMGAPGERYDAMQQRMQQMEQRMDRLEQMNRPSPGR